MAGSGEFVPSRPKDTLSLRLTRFAVYVCLALIAGLLVFAAEAGFDGILAVVVFTMPAWGPHLWILQELRQPNPAKALGWTAGFAGFVSMLSFGFPFLFYAAFHDTGASRPEENLYFPLLGLAHLVLAGLALAAYVQCGTSEQLPVESAPSGGDVAGAPESGQADQLAGSAWKAVGKLLTGLALGAGFVLFLLRGGGPPRGQANDSSAVGALRTLNTAAVTYEGTYNNGYPPSLQALADPGSGQQPSCAAAALIDSTLASGQKSGYRFTYTPGPAVEKAAAGCPPGVKSYTFIARPFEFGKTGRYNLFTDETAIIRVTREDRVATAHDPELQ
jgi:hypothetical protein